MNIMLCITQFSKLQLPSEGQLFDWIQFKVETFFQKKLLNTTGLSAKDSSFMNRRCRLGCRFWKGGPYNFICKSHKYTVPSQPNKATWNLYRIPMTSSKETCSRTPWENGTSSPINSNRLRPEKECPYRKTSACDSFFFCVLFWQHLTFLWVRVRVIWALHPSKWPLAFRTVAFPLIKSRLLLQRKIHWSWLYELDSFQVAFKTLAFLCYFFDQCKDYYLKGKHFSASLEYNS